MPQQEQSRGPQSNLDTGSVLLVLGDKRRVGLKREPQPPRTVSYPGLPEVPGSRAWPHRQTDRSQAIWSRVPGWGQR
jgi:hypothetical protein